MKTYEVIKELNKLKSGQPVTDYSRRDEAIELAKAAIRKVEAMTNSEIAAGDLHD